MYSLCNECSRKVPAELVRKDGKIYVVKKCPEHGEQKEIYFEDAEMYERFKRYDFHEKTLETPFVYGDSCPFSCGLCQNHENTTVLLNVVVTNRCDLSCWYCFFYAKEGRKVYEPSKEEIKKMLEIARKQRRVPPVAVQYTGGEPTLRRDLAELVKLAKDAGFIHVQVNTNGINIALSEDLANNLRNAGVSTYYVSFDGVSPETNHKNHWEFPYFLRNVRKHGKTATVLVPTVIRGVNSHELGDIIKFALTHSDVVRGVNFQPVSFTGRAPREIRNKERITIAGAVKEIERQTNGLIEKEDWYPVPTEVIIAKLASIITGKEYVTFGCHFICGAATYLFKDGKNVRKIRDFVDVDGLLEYAKEVVETANGGKLSLMDKLKVVRRVVSFVDQANMPKGLNLVKILRKVLLSPSYEVLGEFHGRSLFLGMMHFMDVYNYDTERVRRCVIHYATPDGRIIPFCTFNVLPQMYRDKIIEMYGIPWEEWEGEKPKYTRSEDFVMRVKASDEYKKTYGELIDFW